MTANAISNKEVDRAIDGCFLAPCEVTDLPEDFKKSGVRPTLHLLRRDLVRLYHGEDVLWPMQTQHGPPFLICIGMLAGIDMLARFLVAESIHRAGKAQKLGNGDRFKLFVRKIGRLRQYDADFLWAFRNALAHSYGIVLHGGKFEGAGVTLAAGTQEAKWVTKSWVQRKGKRVRRFVVNMWELKALFRQIIDRSERFLRDKKHRSARKRFRAYYESNGFIRVFPEVNKPGVLPTG